MRDFFRLQYQGGMILFALAMATIATNTLPQHHDILIGIGGGCGIVGIFSGIIMLFIKD